MICCLYLRHDYFIITSDLCDSIAEEMGLTLNPPSVMMIRISGIKGVLIRDPSTVGITVRKSMVKFVMDTNISNPLHDTLCVVHCAQYTPVFLNMEVVIFTSIMNYNKNLPQHKDYHEKQCDFN